MLPFNARRIVFEEIRKPEVEFYGYKLVEVEPIKRRSYDPLRNNEGQFFVRIDDQIPYVEELVKRAQNLGLTVSGDGTAPVKGGDIRQARQGDFLSFGSSKKFDMNWIKRPGYLCDKQYAPVYDLRKDWNKVNQALENFARDKKNLTLNDGTNVRFHHGFAVINGKVVPYERGKVAVAIPVEVLRRIVVDMNIINVVLL